MKEDRQAFKNRMRSLRTYREQNPGKGYWEWKRAIQDYKGIDIDNDPTYYYYGFYKENPETAKGILNDSKYSHFTDTYKTSVHPTFSNESKYSGYANKYNPKGVTGGYWGEDNSYNFSDSQIKNNWDIHNTLRYLEDAENYGVTAKYRGMYPKDTDNVIYGGVLPQVEVKAQAFDGGGETNSENNNQDITISPYEDATFVGKAYKGLQSILGKETKDYIGNLSRLKSLSKFIRVSSPIIDFVNYIFPNKRDQYTYNTNKHFRDIIQKDKIQDVTMLKNGGEVEPPYPQFINGQRVNRWTGQPIATGQATPVFDLRDAADFTPAGDVLAVKDTYEAVQNNDWVGAGLAAVGVLPFVPSVTKKLRREIPTVNKNYVSDVIDALDRQRYNRSSAEAAMNNETYEIVQRLMDDPSYMRRANEVKYRYGDDYIVKDKKKRKKNNKDTE